MVARELTCRELVEIVTAYLEGKMSPGERALVEQHLAECPGCTNYLEQMRQTIRLVGRLAEEDLSPQAQEELLRLFRDWHPA